MKIVRGAGKSVSARQTHRGASAHLPPEHGHRGIAQPQSGDRSGIPPFYRPCRDLCDNGTIPTAHAVGYSLSLLRSY